MSGILEGIIKSIKSFGVNDQNLKQQIRGSVVTIKNKGIGSQKNKRTANIQFNDLQDSFFQLEDKISLRVVEYAPTVFAKLREFDQLCISQVEDSLLVEKNQLTINCLFESMGKSGSLFFQRHDQRLIIKTIKKDELEFLNNILTKYFTHIQDNQKSLLARIYGCFTIQIENISPVHLILMENTLQQINQPFISYDLKGSLIGRKSSDIQFGKDLNFLEEDEIFLTIQRETTKMIQNQIRQDSKFLKDLNIMDYSLLLGVSKRLFTSNDIQDQSQTPRSISDELLNIQYSFGLIDYLQKFDQAKYFEAKYKSLFNQQKLISCVSPEQYSQRFISFLYSITCRTKQNG